MQREIIKKMWITEKTGQLREAGTYVFMVEPSATKSEIKKAVAKDYRVHVLDIQTVRLPKKTKRFRSSIQLRPAMKKAIVKLKEGEKIDIL